MNIIPTSMEGVVIIEPRIFEDSRGYFFESFSLQRFREMVCDTVFVQDNEAFSRYGVIRGLHYQLPPHAQSKLVRVVSGKVLDVAVDMRDGSPTFGSHISVVLSASNRRQLFIPRGFAHGYAVLSDIAVFQYKCDNLYAPGSEGGVRFDDPALGIEWGIPQQEMVLSEKDAALPVFQDAPMFDFTCNYYTR